MRMMKALGQTQFGGTEVLKEVSLPVPELRVTDLLVRVKAVGINPADTQVRANVGGVGQLQQEAVVVTGWDGAGMVEEVGSAVGGRFRPGDEVFFAGDLTRRGCHAEYVAVDSRLAGHKPASLSFAESAAVPLAALTVWEGMIEGCGIPREPRLGNPQRALVVGGAGGVGTMAIQILSRVCGLQVVATASRRESAEHCRKMGASVVIDHYKNMKEQLSASGIASVDYVLNTADPNTHFEALTALLAPLGKMCCIQPITKPVNLAPLFQRRISVVFEAMFARSMLRVSPEAQGAILDHVSMLLDAGTLRTPLVKKLLWTVAALAEAHALSETGRAIGKTVLAPV
ncbi:zinc-binding alcohol dehydrogenase family protein [Stigmatella sp. ncwal1]|uniref:Zinc-type alcohol dehydrogenase-like protein n=1 Tax=Stigmatella ashevillensis TaxID=2995309 RepID=A0ABT5DFD7_9BACT|nr:zinc-binding alcohol dehydrogenase family protein [Stigmatella ashevillena]MDC0711513.1 zinc-binding alcohol dehydrogenase family protein [Stigmatella ashevillena]